MLGEGATHGDGETIAFKVALVQRLITQCGFDSVFFEANQEEFIHLNERLRLGQAVSSDDLLSAVGGIWKFYREFQPLASFLLARAQAKQVVLGGLDDQLGQLGQNYANDQMIAELTDLLSPPERQRCGDALHKRIYSDYPEAAPYSEQDRSQIKNCLVKIEAVSAADTAASTVVREERQEIISATERWISRDFVPDGESTASRDRSMFQTFEWLQSRLPKKHKAIIWAATVHVAKQGGPTWGDRNGTNFGSLVHQMYGKRALSLGFSATAGSFRQSKGTFPAIPTAPHDSIEQIAMKSDKEASYVGPSHLISMGTRPGAFFRHSYQILDWANFLDCVVVFPAEHPPSDTRNK
jgi:erythromycin esterase-like protein